MDELLHKLEESGLSFKLYKVYCGILIYMKCMQIIYYYCVTYSQTSANG